MVPEQLFTLTVRTHFLCSKAAHSLAATFFAVGTLALTACSPPAQAQQFRPPAVPLVTSDPYLSIWSESDTLNGSQTVHWTGKRNALVSLIRVDGKTYRLMGDEPSTAAPMPQTSVRVLPTSSVYEFSGAGVHVRMDFLQPALPNDLDALSLPLSYITWTVNSTDGQPHSVSLYDSASSDLAVDTPDQPVVWSRSVSGGMTLLKTGTASQQLLRPAGDDVRIDWGYAYLAAQTSQSTAAEGGADTLEMAFSSAGTLNMPTDTRMPRAASDDEPVMAVALPLGQVTAAPVSRHVIVAYDELYSMDYFGDKLRPYWRRNGASAPQMLAAAEKSYPDLNQRCAAFDSNLMTDMTRVGGAQYAQIAALAYRQAIAACGLCADDKGKPLFLTKENTSNGDIGTVDVFYPMDPMLIFLSPTLAKATLVPILTYAASPHWHFPNAPHDLGTYPIARGRDDGGEAMPVEETGNMLILADAVAHDDGNADFVKPWWPQLTQWAHFLEQYGLDPGDQLCTDDFMGHLAHNANLSVKAILALAAYGDLCRMRGETKTADRYAALAKTDARHWSQVADSGDHSLLAFDKPNTWSEKYNLVWDKLLGLNVFPPSVAAKEVAYYKTAEQQYGVPLDVRTKLAKTDWEIWSATLATNRSDFTTLVNPIYTYLDTQTVRDPLTDLYHTDDVNGDNGFRARPVVGGVFIKMLSDKATWSKWVSLDTENPSGWAKLPAQTVTTIVPASDKAPQQWRYTTTAPDGGEASVGGGSGAWIQPGFDDSSWQLGSGPFASQGESEITTGTNWTTGDIWMRRTFVMPNVSTKDLQLSLYHDEDAQVYFNGVLADNEAGYDNSYISVPITAQARAQLIPGKTVTVAVHCHQTGGGQGIDVGLVSVKTVRG